MRLDELARRAGLGAPVTATTGQGSDPPEVSSVVIDSRAVTPGSLFCCVPGAVTDGHRYAPQAAQAGAVALLVERHLDVGLPQVVVPSVRAALGPVSAAFYGHPSRSLCLVGVTGTNGKTTTVTLLAAIFVAHGWTASALGTLTQSRTTPEAPELQAKLAELVAQGTQAVAMEVSSHALDQHRVDSLRFAAGVFTNLTQDHLDYHRKMEAYFDAKARLFELGRAELAVVNVDDPWGRRLADRLAGRGQQLVTYSLDEVDQVEAGHAGSRFRWQGQQLRVHLGGRFNVSNALAAAVTARALGIEPGAIAAGLDGVSGIPGRFQPVEAGQSFAVLVDYAHTPDSLERALQAARDLTGGHRLLVVFGAGGDRDHAKRPLMGEVAARLADLAVVTSDNPRSEDPQHIIGDILAGVNEPARVVVEVDRARAIATALAAAGPHDVVLVAGKGHETGQQIGGRVLPFDDVREVRQALGRILASRRQRGDQ